MGLIIDAYNVLHCSHVLPERWANVSAAGLCQMIEASGLHGGRAAVVCDGQPKPAERGLEPLDHVRMIHSGSDRDADTVIAQLIDRDDAPRRLKVVTNDRAVQRAARRRGARVESSEAFLRRLAVSLHDRLRGPANPEKPAGEPHPEAWMKTFDLSGDAPDEQALEGEARFWLREFGYESEQED